MENIYDCVLNKAVPINEATTLGIENFLHKTLDDGYYEHKCLTQCIIELEKRGKR